MLMLIHNSTFFRGEAQASYSVRRSLVFRVELQRKRIDAVAESGRFLGAIIKDMAEVTAAMCAHNFRADHTVCRVGFSFD